MAFTIIEVALVLAIAAMIFLVVFLAVPALQRNQRDDARKRDVSNVVAAVESYYGNSGNSALSAPTSQQTVYNSAGPVASSQLGPYLDRLSNNIDGVMIQGFLPAGKITSWGWVIIVATGKQCDGSDKIKNASSRQVAVFVQIESGNPNYSPTRGGDKYYCQDAS